MERLDKLVSVAAGCGRREAQTLIRKGRVLVNGEACRAAEKRFEEDVSLIVDSREVTYRKYVYIMQNKPQGVISATENRNDTRPTVVDILPEELRRPGLFPAGRLDADTTGFVLLTDDGNFAHDILTPKKHVPKRYRVGTDVAPQTDIAERFAQGLTLGDGTVCAPAEVQPVSEREFVVTLHEGMYHQIKRMFAACGAKVISLHRFCMGNLLLDEGLLPGQSRLITETERQMLTQREQDAQK